MDRSIFFGAIFFYTVYLNLHPITALTNETDLKQLTYQMHGSQLWQRDLETPLPRDGYEHYTLSQDTSIDLLFSSTDDFILYSFNKNKKDVFQQILKGKNLIQSLLSEHLIEMKNTNIKTQDEFEILSFETSSKINSQQFFTYETYHLGKGTCLHTTLRWNQNSSPNQVKLARQDFDQLKVNYRNKEDQ